MLRGAHLVPDVVVIVAIIVGVTTINITFRLVVIIIGQSSSCGSSITSGGVGKSIRLDSSPSPAGSIAALPGRPQLRQLDHLLVEAVEQRGEKLLGVLLVTPLLVTLDHADVLQRVVDARRLKGIIVEQLLEVGLSGAPGGAGARLDLPPVRRLEAAKVSSTGIKE